MLRVIILLSLFSTFFSYSMEMDENQNRRSWSDSQIRKVIAKKAIEPKRSVSNNRIQSFTADDFKSYILAQKVAEEVIGLMREYCGEKNVIDNREWLPDAKFHQTTNGLMIRNFFPYRSLVARCGEWNTFFLAEDVELSDEKIDELKDRLREKFKIQGNDLYAPISEYKTKEEEIKESSPIVALKKRFQLISEKNANAIWREMITQYENDKVMQTEYKKPLGLVLKELAINDEEENSSSTSDNN